MCIQQAPPNVTAFLQIVLHGKYYNMYFKGNKTDRHCA